MGGRGAPVEAPCDHGAVVDHSELVWLGPKSVAAAWFCDWRNGYEPFVEPLLLMRLGFDWLLLEDPSGSSFAPSVDHWDAQTARRSTARQHCSGMPPSTPGSSTAPRRDVWSAWGARPLAI